MLDPLSDEQDSFITQIINKINAVPDGTQQTRHKSFPEESHPRRKQLYRPFIVNSDTFFKLKANGVPVLTSYFLSESSNMNRLHTQMKSKNVFERDITHSILNI